jgi:glycosyltransferase involved in cell wall biosynthesis
VSYDLQKPCEAVLVIGGTRDLAGLYRARRGGARIVQRLNGMNWIQRRRRTGLRHFLRAEYGNLLLVTIRNRLAQRVVYQSEFARRWWEREYGRARTPWRVVYNAVDLAQYTPEGPGEPPQDRQRLLLVEGSLGGGYELGLETAVALAERLESAHSQRIELMVVGKVSAELAEGWKKRTAMALNFAGLVPRSEIPALDRSAHLLYAADINAACPNSVIEALACGLPVVSFDTGALPELVTGDAGRIASYGGDVWQLEPPDIPALARAADEILADPGRFRRAARQRAEQAFGLDQMVEAYLNALLND